MSKTTGIEWTDATWNPIRGCTRVSEGCRNCYAETVAARFSGPGQPYEGLATRRPARWTGKVLLVEEHLTDPLRWSKPRRIFVNSMSDLFHESVPDEWIDRIFAVMALAPRHTFQVLTKRPERMRAYLNTWGARGPRRLYVVDAAAALTDSYPDIVEDKFAWPLPNVWLGVSVEDQATADARIPLLLDTPAAVRFVSAEPLLGPVDLGLDAATCDCCPRWGSRWVRLPRPVRGDWCWADTVAEPGVYRASSNKHGALCVKATNGRDLGIKPREFQVLGSLDWLIVGGESGPGARPCDVAWVRSIVEQCRAAGVACFVKQLGAMSRISREEFDPPRVERGQWGKPKHVRSVEAYHKFKSRKGGDPAEWPEDLRVREFPRA